MKEKMFEDAKHIPGLQQVIKVAESLATDPNAVCLLWGLSIPKADALAKAAAECLTILIEAQDAPPTVTLAKLGDIPFLVWGKTEAGAIAVAEGVALDAASGRIQFGCGGVIGVGSK
jgi:hypothetical protein